MTSHIPAPWVLEPRDDLIAGWNMGLSKMPQTDGMSVSRAQMAASLKIAQAAPEMLEALLYIGNQPCPDNVYTWLVSSGVMSKRAEALARAGVSAFQEHTNINDRLLFALKTLHHFATEHEQATNNPIPPAVMQHTLAVIAEAEAF